MGYIGLFIHTYINILILSNYYFYMSKIRSRQDLHILYYNTYSSLYIEIKRK